MGDSTWIWRPSISWLQWIMDAPFLAFLVSLPHLPPAISELCPWTAQNEPETVFQRTRLWKSLRDYHICAFLVHKG